MLPLLGLFGGTFDPIHNGHLALARNLIQKLSSLEKIQFIPSRQPPHRSSPLSSPTDRLEMVTRAIANIPKLVWNDIEIKREAISYTINTLQILRPLFPTYSLCFILSTEAFSNFNRWLGCSTILEYCHLIVINRPHYHLPVQKWLNDFLLHNQTKDPEDLQRFLAGKIFFQSLCLPLISATKIRYHLRKGDYKIVAPLLPVDVFKYIKAHKLYQ